MRFFFSLLYIGWYLREQSSVADFSLLAIVLLTDQGQAGKSVTILAGLEMDF